MKEGFVTVKEKIRKYYKNYLSFFIFFLKLCDICCIILLLGGSKSVSSIGIS